ncbi:MAG: GH25 family lysozyme [Deltaproteobacteria bacterium]|nr:GH25 family lysozyme [Deltaproteobacteria bacterium]
MITRSTTLSALIALGLVACANDVVDAADEGAVMAAGVDATEEEALSSDCADGATVKGIDVSYYQGTIDWNRVANDGVKYAFIRVSDGAGYRDSKFDANWRGAKAQGVLRGAYQYFRSDEDAIRQADLLIEKVGGRLGPGDLPPVIDVESTDGQSRATIVRKVKQWLDRVEDKLGVRPIVYTGPYFWQDNVAADVDSHPLWVAHYGTSCPLVPPTWNRWTFHQYSSTGGVSGIGGNVDMNRFNGTLAELRRLEAGPQLPAACVSRRFRGEFCDDESKPAEAIHNQLVRTLDVDFHCRDIAGSRAFCPQAAVTRSQAMFVLGKAARIPLAGAANAFRDDNDDSYERYLNAGKEHGILMGNAQREVNPDGRATRNTLAVMLDRMYKLPDVGRDYFFDDDGDADEHIHNAVAAAGLFSGYDDGRHQRRAFKGADVATRSMLATVAVRAHDQALVPVWKIPAACLSGNFDGAFCDDDESAAGANHDRLVGELGVPFSCDDLDGEAAFCGARKATRAEAMYVIGKAAHLPLAGAPDAFVDDNDNPYERWLNAANVLGIVRGYAGRHAKPDEIATRNTIATLLFRSYALAPGLEDAFTDDDGDADEAMHDAVYAAGLFMGSSDGNGGRAFKGDLPANRSTLATVAVRAKDAALIPIW